MFLIIRSTDTTINLDRFDLIRATGKKVEAAKGMFSICVAECESESDAKLLQRAISDAWTSAQRMFVVDTWLFQKKNNLQ